MHVGPRVARLLSAATLVLAGACAAPSNADRREGVDEAQHDQHDQHDQDDDSGESSGGAPLEVDPFPAQAPSDPAAVYDCDFTETFDGPTGAPWPEPWIAFGEIAAADLRSGWGRLRPATSDYSLARMIAPLDCQDFDASVTFMLTDKVTQLAGIYGRHNGGFLQKTSPRGRGYAVTAENFRTTDGLSLWRELGGTEQDISPTTPLVFEAFVAYRMRLRIKQQTPETTLLRGKVWLASEPEPEAWTVEVLDSASALRKRGGSVALDAFSGLTAGEARDIYFDDLVVTQALPVPEPKFYFSG